MAIVYTHIRLDNNSIFYIGIGHNTERAYSKKSRNRHWHTIVKKTDYSVEILYDNIEIEEAQEIEIKLIKYYGRQDLNEGNLVNMTDGGESTINISIESRQKLSNHAKTRIPPMLGKHHSKETKQKLSDANKNVPLSEERKRKISESGKGKNIIIHLPEKEEF